MRLLGVFVLATVILSAANTQAGVIHPALQATLDQTPEREPISVIVHLADQPPIAAMDAELRARGATRLERHREIVLALREAAARSQAPLKAALDTRLGNGGVLGYTPYWISNLIVVQALPAEIVNIAARPDVQAVELNFRAELIGRVNPEDRSDIEAPIPATIGITPGQQAIRSPEVWHLLGFTGAGRLIGSCDTGVDGNHPALRSRWRGNNGHPWQECWLDVLGTATTYPNDGNAHGTHTTGTMTGVAPDDTIGVAWGAQWIATNVINQDVSSAFDNDVIQCYQWFTDPDGNPGTIDDVPDVVQNSWGVYEGLGYPNCHSYWWTVIDNCEAAGVVTVWSAGNEGSGAGTLRSPADRALTTTNCFSVGAVDATSYSWPYPIAGFSSRGPTMCSGVPPANQIKPEVSAPGVNVYSSVPGGGYDGTYSGTSMAGPHVAGIVALMRQANPDLDVEIIKQILMISARDEGTTGEDNTYGWGFVDAYAAVLLSIDGFGEVEGVVRNGSHLGNPIPGAEVRLVGTDYRFIANGSGAYHGFAPPGNYTAHASAPGFDTQDVAVVVVAGGAVVQDFDLNDIAGPAITNVAQPVATSDTAGPYTITASVTDPSTVAQVKLFHRANGGAWQESGMVLSGADYSGSIPGAPVSSLVEYYVWAEDAVGFETIDPPGAPGVSHPLYITETLYAYEAENPGDPGWQLGVPGDAADAGIWVRADPVGTVYEGTTIQPEDDHTAPPGAMCFVTGNGSAGGAAGAADVDHGCTTLQSPVFDLTSADRAFVKYWRWYGEGGNAIDDEFAVDVSDDGGADWVPLERVPTIENSWSSEAFDLSPLIDFTGQVVFRFVACDLNSQGLVEGAVDDFSVEIWAPLTDVESGAGGGMKVFSLTQNRPNPFNPVTTILFELPGTQAVSLAVYSVDGRKVATLVNGELAAGRHAMTWDGRDQHGEPVSSGIYFYRLEAGDQVAMRRMVLMK